MAQERTRSNSHRAVYDPSTNFFDIEESAPIAPDTLSLDELDEFICERAYSGDPVRWRCLITRFGSRFGRDAHYKISYAVSLLKSMRRVRIEEWRTPEIIVPIRESRPKTGADDFRFGRLKA